MALLAEELVEEWLNRQGYFTIRGIKLGVQEIDILAIKPGANGSVSCRHIEAQASMRPISYISSAPKLLQKQGRAANSVKRSNSELRQGVKEWVQKKFRMPKKRKLKADLFDGQWSEELVINVVRSDKEVDLISKSGVKIHRLSDIVSSLADEALVVKSAAGADFVDLLQMGIAQNRQALGPAHGVD